MTNAFHLAVQQHIDHLRGEGFVEINGVVLRDDPPLAQISARDKEGDWTRFDATVHPQTGSPSIQRIRR